MSPARRRQRGYFIVLDGPDGCGKSTQVERLTARLKQAGRQATSVRDPGGTAVSERIREVLLDARLGHLDALTELLLYMASRAELVASVIRPALENGVTVVSDRFLSSTLVYQGYAGGLEPREILRIGRIVCRGAWPDRTILLDVPAEDGFARIRRAHDRMELKGLEFHRRVAQGFRDLAAGDPAAYTLLDARGPADEVAGKIWEVVERVVR